jgi:hypothetical protein
VIARKTAKAILVYSFKSLCRVVLCGDAGVCNGSWTCDDDRQRGFVEEVSGFVEEALGFAEEVLWSGSIRCGMTQLD